MTKTNTRSILIAMLAAASVAGAGAVPAAAAPVGHKDLEEKGYSCVHASDNNTICTDSNGHEWYCEESTDECGQVKLQVTKKVKVPVSVVGATLHSTAFLARRAPAPHHPRHS